jgi:hypothetical protein
MISFRLWNAELDHGQAVFGREEPADFRPAERWIKLGVQKGWSLIVVDPLRALEGTHLLLTSAKPDTSGR